MAPNGNRATVPALHDAVLNADSALRSFFSLHRNAEIHENIARQKNGHDDSTESFD